jgi:hypothetical protein
VCIATTAKSQGATIDATNCAGECKRSGELGLKINYSTPAGNFASYNIEASSSFNVASATFLELLAKGESGGERFEVVLWSNRDGGFPGRPANALLSVGKKWKRHRIPIGDFSSPNVDLSKLFRLSIGFNDAIHPAGVVFLDDIRFVDANGSPVYIALNEDTNVTNIGLYMASMAGAVRVGIEDPGSAASKLSRTLASIEALEKFHGFPQTHNHVASLKPALGDRCISFVDLGYLAAGLILVRRQFPELATRATALLDAMDWAWFHDEAVGLPHGCRFPDGSTASFHYDFFAADSMLAHFISIGTDEMPPGSFNNLNRAGEGARCASNGFFTPGWQGGGLFMQFFPTIFLDNTGTLLRQSACAFAEDQICFFARLGAPAWGSSAVGVPPFSCEYCGFGCDRNDLLTAHASVLAVDCVGRSALVQNLRSLEGLGARPPASDGTASFDLGFRSAVNWQTRQVSTNQLILEQAMLLLSLCNELNDDSIRRLFCADPITFHASMLIPEFRLTCVPIPTDQP